MADTPKTVQIDSRILSLLGLEDEYELSYLEYIQHLKEAMVASRMSKSKFSNEEAELITNEWKRVKSKKGRFRPKAKKITASSLGIGTGIKKPMKISQKRLPLSGTKAAPGPTAAPKEKIANIKKEDNVLIRINNTLNSILKTLIDANNQNKKKSESERISAEEKGRAGREKESESRPFDKIKKAFEVITKPFKSILDRIINFIVMTLLGRAMMKLFDWFADPKNKDKIQSIIRFFKDHWPILLAAYLRFGTGIGRFIGKLSGIVIHGAIKLAAVVAQLAVKAGIGSAGGKLSKVAGFLGGKNAKLLGAGLEVAATVGTTMLAGKAIEGFAGGEEKPQAQELAGGGYVRPRFPAFNSGGFNFKGMMGGASMGAMFGPMGMLLGGALGSGKPQEIASGFVSGEKGVDKVPAMLSDGEFVMSAGAVQKYGVDTLEGMNAAGGGTNQPKIVSGKTHAAGGGAIGTAADLIKKEEALSSITPGKNDYIKPGGQSVISGFNWNRITNKTPVHAYPDSKGIPTIGWGSTFYDGIVSGTKKVKMGDTIAKEKADTMLSSNIGQLSNKYTTQIKYWKNMSPSQQAAILSIGYNAGASAPTGAYPKLSAAIASGNMVEASKNVHRGGPSPERLEMERKLLLSGPKNITKSISPTPTSTREQPNIFQKIGSGIASKFSSGGLVSGEKGVDKVPAMLSNHEFVMSTGAVQKYGEDTLEGMNAAGGGTNKPKIVSGKTHAAGGGRIGAGEGRPGGNSNGSDSNLREKLNEFFRRHGAGNNFNISNPKTWNIGGGGGTSVSGGGGAGGFLSGLGYVGRAAGEVGKKINKVTGEAGKIVAPTVARAQKVAGEVGKKINPVIKSISGFRPDLSGIQTLGSNIHGASTEAIPALLSSTIGLSRTDKNISQDMQRALLQARSSAMKGGRKNVDYGDYAGGGLSAGGLTMGRIGDNEWKRDAKGRITGLRQVYDTNRSAKDAMDQAGQSFNAFRKSGGRDVSSLGRAAYKPFEALLAKVQNRGKTLHDVNFDEKVLGFKPGEEVLNDTQRGMIKDQKNREDLQNKRPWWDKMGMFGGASRVAQEQAKSKQVGKTKPKPKGITPLPTAPRTRFGPQGKGSKNATEARGGVQRPPSGSATHSKGTRTAQAVLGVKKK